MKIQKKKTAPKRYTRVYPKVSGLSQNEMNNNNKHSLRRAMAAKLTGLTHKIEIPLHLVAESCTICSSRSRWPVLKLLVSPSCIFTDKDCDSYVTGPSTRQGGRTMTTFRNCLTVAKIWS